MAEDMAKSGFDLARGRGRRCLVVDADRTLAPADTGRLVGRQLGVDDAIRCVFEHHGYAEDAFAKVAAVWGTLDVAAYLDVVREVGMTVEPHAAWLEVFAAVAATCPVIVVTAGIPQAWRHVLHRHGHGAIPVVGGCHPSLDSYVVCPETKAELVGGLQAAGWSVVAAGDSLIDLAMLRAADVPLFVPDHKGSPGLVARLHEVSGARHFSVDAREFPCLATCTVAELIELLNEGGHPDADRPDRRTADALVAGRDAARGCAGATARPSSP